MHKKTDMFGDEMKSETAEDFATLFAESEGPGRTLKVGDTLEGEILSIGKESSFVSTGTMNDGQIPTLELKDPTGQRTYKVGDKIKVKVVRVREGELLLKRADSIGSSDDAESLEDAYDLELPVKGKVTEAVKGGYRVEVQGQRGFCPFSQIDLRAGSDPGEYIGKTFEFIITQLESRNLVVSRRKLLELKQAEGEGAFMLSRKPGDRLSGTITRLERFGAFCRLEDGVEGLIPISELAWGRVQHPSEVVREGQNVSVILMRISEEGDRLRVALSLKQAGDDGDPWLKVPQNYPVGSIHNGTIERRENYGLFVNLAPGVTGLMPRSKWRDHLESASFEHKKKGETIKVMISEVNFEDHRLTLSPPSEADDQSWREHAPAAVAKGAKGMGTFGDLFKNAAQTQPQKRK